MEKINISDVLIYKNPQTIIINRKKGFLVMGICDIGGGLNRVQNIIINQTEENKTNSLRIAELESLLKENNIEGKFSLINHPFDEGLFITSTDRISLITFKANSIKLNPISDSLNLIYQEGSDYLPWSLHHLLIIHENLTSAALLKCFKTAVETKKQIENMKGVPLLVENHADDDCLVVASVIDNETCSLEGNPVENLSFERELSESIKHIMVENSKKAFNESNFSKGILDFIYESGVTLEDLVNAGMELCVGVEISPELKEALGKQILKSLADINVIALIMAGIRVEEDFKHHRLREVNVDDDPAYLYSDEVLGMAIANQIAGTKAIFNFKRYDELKPGILSTLGPMLDDVFAGLVAGCMSKIFEE